MLTFLMNMKTEGCKSFLNKGDDINVDSDKQFT